MKSMPRMSTSEETFPSAKRHNTTKRLSRRNIWSLFSLFLLLEVSSFRYTEWLKLVPSPCKILRKQPRRHSNRRQILTSCTKQTNRKYIRCNTKIFWINGDVDELRNEMFWFALQLFHGKVLDWVVCIISSSMLIDVICNLTWYRTRDKTKRISKNISFTMRRDMMNVA